MADERLTMQKFFKGQKIKIKKLKNIKNPKYFPILVPEMERYCGKEGRIIDASNDVYKEDYTYNVFGWTWREDWMEPEDFLTEMDFEI